MFKRLKNWILDRPAEDHAVASFAWLGGAYLAIGSAVAFPAIAPVAAGAAILATKVGILEGIISAAHVVNDVFSWGFRKIFKPKTQKLPTKIAPIEPNSQQEKSKEQEHSSEKTQDKPQTITKENPQPSAPQVQKLAPEVSPKAPQKEQLVQIPSEQLMILVQQVQALTVQMKQMQREVIALRLENKKLKHQNKQMTRRSSRRPMPQGLVVHRHFIKNGRLMHE